MKRKCLLGGGKKVLLIDKQIYKTKRNQLYLKISFQRDKEKPLSIFFYKKKLWIEKKRKMKSMDKKNKYIQIRLSNW